MCATLRLVFYSGVECEQCGAPITTKATDGYFECPFCRTRTRAPSISVDEPALVQTPAVAVVRDVARPRSPSPASSTTASKRARVKGSRVSCGVWLVLGLVGLGLVGVFFASDCDSATLLGPSVVSFTSHVCFERVNDDDAVDVIAEVFTSRSDWRLFAVDGLNGDALWATEFSAPSAFDGFAGDARTVMMGMPDFHLVGVDVRTGKTKWNQGFADVVRTVVPSATEPCAIATLANGDDVPFALDTGVTLAECPNIPPSEDDDDENRWSTTQGGGLTVAVRARERGTPTVTATAFSSLRDVEQLDEGDRQGDPLLSAGQSSDHGGAEPADPRWFTPLQTLALDHGAFAGFDGTNFVVVGQGIGNDHILFFTLEAATGRVLRTAEETDDNRDADDISDIRFANGLLYIHSFATTIAYDPRTFEEIWSIGW